MCKEYLIDRAKKQLKTLGYIMESLQDIQQPDTKAREKLDLVLQYVGYSEFFWEEYEVEYKRLKAAKILN